MTIPVFLRDTFYLIENSTSEEIFKILKEEGIDSATLRGKATFQFPAASFDAVKSVIKGSLANAQIAFYQAGESFFAMPITSVESLSYYKTSDGKLYASEQDYHMNKLSQTSKPIYNPEQGNIRVINPELGNVISAESSKVISPEVQSAPTQVSEDTDTVAEAVEKVETGVTPKKVPVRVKRVPVQQTYRFVAPEVETATITGVEHEEAASLDKKVETVGTKKVEQGLAPASQYKDEYTLEEEIFLENAGFLDGVLSSEKYHNIADYLLLNLGDVKRLMDVMGEEFEQEIKIPMLREAFMSEFVKGSLPEGKFSYEVGESERLIDSIITLPVFSALLGKRNKSLQNKFSVANLVGSKFARVSVAGISSSGTLCGFVHFEEITNEAVAAAKKKVEAQLEADGKKFSDLSSQEKYELYLQEISNYYVNHKDCGKMLEAPTSSRYVDLSKALADVENQKFSVPEFYDSEQGMIIWPRHETILFDNRGEKSLLDQAKAVIKPKKVLVTATEERPAPIFNPEFVENVTRVETTEVIRPLPQTKVEEAVGSVETATVIPLPSSFETAEVIKAPSRFETAEDVLSGEEETQNNGLTQGEIDSLLHTLVRSSKPAVATVPKKAERGIAPGERVITDSIKFSNTPSLVNPIAYIDENGHEWESEEAYKLAISSIGISGDLLGDNPLELLEDDTVKKR